MLPAAFSTSATTWKQPKRQQVEERGKKCGAYINGTLFIKKKYTEVFLMAATWVGLEGTMPSEVRRRKQMPNDLTSFGI